MTSDAADSMTSSLAVCLVTQWYHPEPVNVPGWLVSALRRQGVRVSVLTGVPNYPTGEVAAGYSAFAVRHDVLDDVRVHRTPLYPSHDRSAPRRMGNYASWALSSAALGQDSIRSVDAALVYSSPATAAAPAMLGRALSGTPYVLMIEDLWPDSVFASGFLRGGRRYRLLRALLDRWVNLSYRHAAHVVVVSPGAFDLLLARGVPRHKLSLVYNWADEQTFKPAAPDTGMRPSLGIGPDDFVLMYAGNHGPAQALSTTIDAFHSMRDHVDRHLVFVGDGISKSELQEQARSRDLRRVHFLGSRSAAEMPGLLAAADVQLVSLRDEELFQVTMPGKMQTCLASGLPTLVAIRGDAARVAIESGSGLVATPGDPSSIAAAVERFATMPAAQRRSMGESAHAWYYRNMAEQVGAARLTSILRAASGSRRRGAAHPRPDRVAQSPSHCGAPR